LLLFCVFVASENIVELLLLNIEYAFYVVEEVRELILVLGLAQEYFYTVYFA